MDAVTFDPSKIDGLFSEPVVLHDHELVLGLMHLAGAGLRVCTWDGKNTRHMSPAAARRFAKQLADCDDAPMFRPVRHLRSTAAMKRCARLGLAGVHAAPSRLMRGGRQSCERSLSRLPGNEKLPLFAPTLRPERNAPTFRSNVQPQDNHE